MEAGIAAVYYKPTEDTKPPVKTPYDLANQNTIQYGLIPGTLTWQFFRTSNNTAIQTMWETMYNSNPSVFEWTSRKGIERVRESNGKYVFFVESAFADYLTSQPPCNLGVMKQLLNPREYAFALQKGSPIIRRVNRALRSLAQENVFARLKRKWWKGKCSKQRDDESSSDLDTSQEKSTYQNDGSEGKGNKKKPRPVSSNTVSPSSTGHSVMSRGPPSVQLSIIPFVLANLGSLLYLHCDLVHFPLLLR